MGQDESLYRLHPDEEAPVKSEVCHTTTDFLVVASVLWIMAGV